MLIATERPRADHSDASTKYRWTYTKHPIAFENYAFGGADRHPVLLDDGRIRLHFLAHYPSTPENGPKSLGSPSVTDAMAAAVSEDGIRFTMEHDRTFVHQGSTDPDVFRTGNGWTMLVSAGQTLIRAISNDGLHFAYQNSIRLGGAVSSTAIVSGQLTTFYCSSGGIAASATDGVSWGSGRTVLQEDKLVCDPSVIQLDDGTYKLYYKEVNPPAAAPGGKQPPTPDGQR